MARTMENLSTVNSFLRTLMGLVVMGAVALGGWFGYSTYFKGEFDAQQKQRDLDATRDQLRTVQFELDQSVAEIGALREDVKAKAELIQRLDTSLRLLKVDHRVARLTVVDQIGSAEDNNLISVIEFVELDDRGKPVDEPRLFRIKGDVVYLDNWVVKFDDKFVEQADIDRSTSLVLFRRIFGEQQQPQEGFLLDAAAGAPRVYTRGGEPSDFERRIWKDFWTIANDESKAKEMGIRAAHGEAVSIKALKGKSYKVNLRASDGISIGVDDSAPPRVEKPAA